MPVTPDERFAIDLADTTGRVLQQARADADPDTPLTDLKALGDAAAQAHIAQRLANAYPDDAVLSEEAPDDPARLHADRVWIIDPLDGTREYAEHRTDWAVHIALWQRTGPRDAGGPAGQLTAAAVAVPDQHLTLSTATPAAVPDASGGPLRIAVSRTRPPEIIGHIVDHLAAGGIVSELVPMGSAGVKISAVIRGLADGYVHAGGQYQWDSAAPVAVAHAAGLHTSRVTGDPLDYNQPSPYLPDLIVCRSELAELILSAAQTSPH